MATRKRKTAKRRTRRNPTKRHVAPRKRRRHRSSTGLAVRRNPSHGPIVGYRKKQHRRRSTRRNPSISTADWKKLGIATAIAAVGGFAGVAATTALESHVSQPPRTLGLIKLAAAALGLYAGAKVGQPLAGIAFAGAMGASAGKDLVSSFSGAAAPAAAAGAAAAGAGANGASTDPAAQAAAAQQQADMQAVMDDDDDMDGADGMAAVYDDDENDDDAFEDGQGDFENQDFDRAFAME